ncbi:1,4-alpha-glucan branching protein GlgB [Solicola sp. PLA-1-18]|uniref:1,4-alpha-glucan branching protein GlgB n=1 Tax=Solicola sp. PLA-1-18 TaxID=3380532 RepID=UPI003B78191B
MRELDRHLFGEGRHEELWKVLGAHPTATGTSFSVWAPRARTVQVAGDFNGWNGGEHTMSRDDLGVWELEVEGVGPGALYKYKVESPDGRWTDKADPMAQYAQQPPQTASVVYRSDYTWDDAAWMTQRAASRPHAEPMSIYELHLGSWRLGLTYREIAAELADYVRDAGFTHVELMPVMEHPFGGSWGYQVSGYYAPTSRFGEPDDFRFLVDTLHQAGIGVILDWVPAHFPKDEFALSYFDGTATYEHPDPWRGEHPDWGTLIFDFGRNEVRNFLIANALYWMEEFHVDGLRVDAVASMIYLDYSREHDQWRPNIHGGRENLEAVAFMQELNATAYKLHPGVAMIAEESTAWPGVTRSTDHGGLGYGFKWNLGWMHDSLGYMREEPVNRRYHHHELSFAMMYAYADNFLLPLSHDEVVHGKGSLLTKMPGDRWQQLANLRAYYAFQWSHPGKQLLFMGSEFGQEREWSEERSLDWGHLDDPGHAGLLRFVHDLNVAYRERPALWGADHDPTGFTWIDADDRDHNVFSYLRSSGDDQLVCVVNFAGVPHEDFRVGLPSGGTWRQVLSSDDLAYGGSGVVNDETLTADEGFAWNGWPSSVGLRVPPLGAVWLEPVR